MQSPTTKISAPKSGAVIEIKDWITGQDAEYIDQALTGGLDVKPDMAKKSISFGKIDAGNILNEQAHREIEKFIVSVNNIADNVLKEILELPEEDYVFVQNEISSRRKKKEVEPDGQ